MPYGKTSKEAMEREQIGSGSEFWRPNDGENVIRILPPWNEDTEGRFWRKTGTHFNVGPDGRAVPCPLIGGATESCWLCRKSKTLSGSDDEDDRKDSEEFSARTSYVMNIIDLDSPEEAVQIWRCGVKAFRVIKKLVRNDDWGDPTDFDEGYNITVDKTGSGLTTNYDIIPSGRAGAEFPTEKQLNHRSDSVADMFADLADQTLELNNLDEFQNFLNEKEMEGVYFGRTATSSRTESKPERRSRDDATDEEKSEEETKEDKPKRRRGRRAAASEEKSEDEGDGNDSDGDGDEEKGEEKKPSKRLRRGRASLD